MAAVAVAAGRSVAPAGGLAGVSRLVGLPGHAVTLSVQDSAGRRKTVLAAKELECKPRIHFVRHPDFGAYRQGICYKKPWSPHLSYSRLFAFIRG
jgi:hypothetical protein